MSDSQRILVIDDSTTLRKLVEIAFRGTRAEVDFAATGTEGITRAIAHPPDVVLLDFILPDMRGVEVCQRLASHGGTAHVPVVIMSAKGEGLQDAFREFPRVIDFVTKPFAVEEIRNRLGTAMKRAGAQAARGSQPSDIAPIDATPVPAPRAKTPTFRPISPAVDEIVLAGDLGLIPPLDVLRFVANPGVTGCLTLEVGAHVCVYLRHGEVLMCTTTNTEVVDVGELDLGRVPRSELEKARLEQSRTGKPPAVTLAENGFIRASDLPVALRGTSKRLMRMVLDARAGRFQWQSTNALPTYVEAFGRPLSTTSLALDTLRMRTPEPVPTAFFDAVFERTPRFSRKLAGARLSPTEQTVLSLIDGETPLRLLIERTGLAPERAASVFARMRAVDLVQIREHSTGVGEEHLPRGAVAILDPDTKGFVKPLREVLKRRPQPIDLIDLSELSDPSATVIRNKPRLVLLTSPGRELLDKLMPVARSTSAIVVVLLQSAAGGAVDAQLAAGVDAVLVKPIHVNEIERLLST
ncbi:MAG: response regulator [Kofleriaceae bacterium]